MPEPHNPEPRNPDPADPAPPAPTATAPPKLPAPAPPAPTETAPLADRLAAMPGVARLVAEAESTWRARAQAAGDPTPTRPGWRAFEDSFPTFYEFTNRPR